MFPIVETFVVRIIHVGRLVERFRMSRNDLLFCEHDLDAKLRAHLGSIGSKVDSIPQAQFMNARPEEIVEHLSAEMAIDPWEGLRDVSPGVRDPIRKGVPRR